MNSELSYGEIDLFPKPGIGQVEKTITATQPGRIHFRATSWPARFCYPDSQPDGSLKVIPGEDVIVVGRQGITLLVVPTNQEG